MKGPRGWEKFQDKIANEGAEGMEEDQDEVASEEDKDIEEDPEVIARRGDDEIEEDPKNVTRKVAKELRTSRAKMQCFGEIPRVPVGTRWSTRKGCYYSGVHRSMQAGIQGSKVSGACSIVVSGQYDGDEDLGDTILYVGAGGGIDNNGWPKRPGPQVFHQEWTGWGNEALRKSCDTGKPVRVVRSSKFLSEFAPYSGYRYDGLYTVTHACRKMDEADQLYICRYILERIPGQPPLPRRDNYGIEMSRYSPASMATSDTVVLPSGASTSHKRKAYFEDDPLIHADTRYMRRKLFHQLVLDYDSDDEEGQDEDLVLESEGSVAEGSEIGTSGR
ncbi:PUA-like domain-containing protein [Suillus spraguei]|nr:PUA-like domain-containing protein [Suillus spraguei]